MKKRSPIFNAIEERIGRCFLFFHTDKDQVTHVRAYGPHGWTFSNSSSSQRDRDSVLALARRQCMIYNMKIQEQNYGKDVEK